MNLPTLPPDPEWTPLARKLQAVYLRQSGPKHFGYHAPETWNAVAEVALSESGHSEVVEALKRARVRMMQYGEKREEIEEIDFALAKARELSQALGCLATLSTRNHLRWFHLVYYCLLCRTFPPPNPQSSPVNPHHVYAVIWVEPWMSTAR